MARRRYLSTTVSTDKVVNRLAMKYGDFSALLYTWLIPHAADDCSFPADPEELMMIVMPGRRDKEPADIQTALDAMLTEGLILHDPDNPDALMFPPPSFYRHQTYIKEDRQRKTPQNAATPETALNDAENGASRAPASFPVSVSSPVSVSLSTPDGVSNWAAHAAPPPPPAEPLEETTEKASTQRADIAEMRAMWGKFVEETGAEPTAKGERGKWNGAIRELWIAGVRAEQIPDLMAAYVTRYGESIDRNPRALANNLSQLMQPAARASPLVLVGRKPSIDTSPVDELARERRTGRFRDEERR